MPDPIQKRTLNRIAVKPLLSKISFRQKAAISLTLASLVMSALWLQPRAIQANVMQATSERQVNVPYLVEVPYTPAIFWLGKVDPTNNYADVRVLYYDELLKVVVHVIDRMLWTDPNQDPSQLAQWDAVSLYLDLDGNTGGAPSANAYRFEVQLYNLQAAYQGDGTDWVTASIPFATTTEWRGDGGPNSNVDAKGWVAYFEIPFTSLGLSRRPPVGTTWGLSVGLHDRDDPDGSVILDTVWPETMQPDIPATWGKMRFGIPGYNSPPAIQTAEVTIREGMDGAMVKDAHVGGHTVCGDPYGPDYWLGWGSANYAGYDQINIQNQWDIADWPCFSKYYVTFPLDALPPGQTILSATLTMYLFGNAGGGVWGEPPDTYIQVFKVGEDWDENSLTWNNAPLALENISGTWVHPRDYEQPDTPYIWDVSRAVADAYASGENLSLALYSADGEYHSGKYFWSSDVGDWAADFRPTLRVKVGTPCTDPDVECHYFYVPFTFK